MPSRRARSTVQRGGRSDDHINPRDERIEKLERQVKTLTHQINILNADNNAPAHDDGNYEPRPGALRNHNSIISQPYNYCDDDDGGGEIEFSCYNGTGEEEFLEWLSEVKRIFEIERIPNDKKVILAAVKLKGLASIWWKYLTSMRERRGKPKITSWEKMERKMMEKFLPINYKLVLFQRLQDLQQGDMSVDDYTQEFDYLVNKNGFTTETEEQLVRRYIGGLRPEFQGVQAIELSRTISEVYERAQVVEKLLRVIRMDNLRCQSEQSNATWGREDRDSSMRNFDREEKGKGMCVSRFKCNKMGHIPSESRKCTTNVANSSSQVEDGEGVPSELYEPGNTFACTVKGKVCRVMISGGCCENIISQEAVDRLQLKVENLPAPYQLAGFNGDQVITISNRCLVSFSFGDTYHDTLWLEVAEIVICDIILGTPWQYDREAIYSGRENTYTISKDNKKIVLAPVREKVDSKLDSVVPLIYLYRKN